MPHRIITISPFSIPKLQLKRLPNGVSLAFRCRPHVLDPALPTVLFSHPLLTDSTYFAPQFCDPALGLGKTHNLIAVDTHGHGFTTGRATYTFWDTATDTWLLMVFLPAPRNDALRSAGSAGRFGQPPRIRRRALTLGPSARSLLTA